MSGYTRRGFMSAAVVASGAGIGGGAARGEGNGMLTEIETMPNVCAHEHWGSLQAVGHTDVGFVADTLCGASGAGVGLFDLLLCPYLHGFLACGGLDSAGLARESGFPDVLAMAREAPDRLTEALLPHLAHQRSVGTLMCLTLGMRELYDLDLDGLSPANTGRFQEAVRAHYHDMHAWYRLAMHRAHLAGVIRPVELSWMMEDQNAAAAAKERAFTRPILRIDGFIEAYRKPSERLEFCKRATGIEPRDAASWRELLARAFQSADERGSVGIKQLQAYTRDLDFAVRDDSEIDFSPDAKETRPFQDFIVHECLKLANDRGWPFQIHIGAANLPNSGPLPLVPLFHRYPRVKFVLIHTWPYFDECAFLAHFHPNVYIDTCWLAVLSPSFLERALQTYIGFLPSHKLMLSHDATSIEMAVGSARLNRTLLAKTLASQVADGRVTVEQALSLSRAVLHGNARDVYAL